MKTIGHGWDAIKSCKRSAAVAVLAVLSSGTPAASKTAPLYDPNPPAITLLNVLDVTATSQFGSCLAGSIINVPRSVYIIITGMAVDPIPSSGFDARSVNYSLNGNPFSLAVIQNPWFVQNATDFADYVSPSAVPQITVAKFLVNDLAGNFVSAVCTINQY